MDRVESVGPNPHQFNVRCGTFSESGDTIIGPLTSRPSHQWLRINHYFTKSRQEFLRRIARGKPDMPTQRDPAEFDGYQATDVDDRTIWRFLPALKSRLERVESRKLVPYS